MIQYRRLERLYQILISMLLLELYGVLAVEKMVPGSQLTRFARQYYNHPNFWVYI